MIYTCTKIIKHEIGIRFLFGCVCVIVALGFSALEPLVRICRAPQWQPSGYHISLLMSALSSDLFASFIAIVSVLPFSASYIDEIKSKFVQIYVLRTGYFTYLATKVIICFVLGGIVVLAGILVVYFLCLLLVFPLEKPAETSLDSVTNLLKTCELSFLSGSLWAVLGMAMSAVMESKYIAYASPFVAYYLMVILYERYFPDAWLLYPRNWLNPDIWPYGVGSAAVFLLELTFFAGLLFYVRGRMRLESL